MHTLTTIVECSDATLAGPGGGLLCVRGEPVATLVEPDTVSVLAAQVGSAAPLPELIGILTAARPDGIMVLGNCDESYALALAMKQGRIVSAAGPEPLQSMGPWLVEMHKRHAVALRGSATPADAQMIRTLDPARGFVVESALEALDRCDEPGARILLILGEARWLHEELEAPTSPDLPFVLMEYARRTDEMPTIEEAIGGARQLVTPLRRPAERPESRPKATRGADWDFFEDPDDAAESEWLDARYVFPFCDGLTDVETLVDHTLLGRFRTLSAIQVLAERGHVALVDHDCELDAVAELVAALA